MKTLESEREAALSLETLEALPEPARRYLEHAIAPGALPAKEAAFRLRGEIRLRRWTAFTAEQTIVAGKGARWEGQAKLLGLPARGFDACVRGFGQTEWTLGGVLPFRWARGADVSRAEIARMAAESILFPSVLWGRNVRWTSDGPNAATYAMDLFGRTTSVALTLSPDGAVESFAYERWGRPNGLRAGLYPYGGMVEEEATFDGLTIPSRLRMGWLFGTERFEHDGEEYRFTVERAEYR